MATLRDNPPAWCAQFIDLPFTEGGRDRRGLDCWGLVRLVYAERFGAMLPEDAADVTPHSDGSKLTRFMIEEAGSDRWRRVASEGDDPGTIASAVRVGDVLAFRGLPPHVGLVASRSKMLHTLEGRQSHLVRWTDPAWFPKFQGAFRLAAPVCMNWNPSPLLSTGRRETMPEGMTIAQMLERMGLLQAAGSLCVRLAGVEVPSHAWATVKPRAGRQVDVLARYRGGGDGQKDPTRTILTVAVIAAAIGVQAIPGVGQVGGAFLAAGVTAGGGLLINAIAPIRAPELDELAGRAGLSPSISGARNQARPFRPIPQVLGRHRMAPPYGAKTYTEIVGDDQYLRLYFDFGKGPLQLEDFKIGDTPLDDFQDVEMEVRAGYPDDAPITLFPSSVTEEQLSVDLTNAAGWVQRTTAAGTDEISMDITFPLGIATLDRQQNRSTNTVLFDVEYAPAGSGAWTKVRGDDESVDSARMLSAMFRPPSTRLVSLVSIVPLQWSDDGAWGPKPTQAPATRFAVVYRGYINLTADPEFLLSGSDTVEFALDSGGTAELRIGDQVVVERFGNPAREGAGAPDFTVSNASTALRRGWQPFELRMDCRNGEAGAIAVGVRYAGQPSFKALPDSVLSAFPYYGFGTSNGWARYVRYEVWNTAQVAGTIIATDDRTETVRRSLAWAVDRGQYDVRVRRTSPDPEPDDLQNISQSVWTALRSIDTTDPVDQPGSARVAVRIRATDQLNGVVDTFNAIVTSIAPDYDEQTGTWIERATNSPASLYRLVMQGPSNKRPLPDGRLDIAELEAWHDDCRELGLTFNKIMDTEGTVRDALQQICAAGRASYGIRDSLHSVVRDRVQTVPSQHFTPRNSVGFIGQRRFPAEVHAYRVRFIDETDGLYNEAERIVLDDGYQIDGLDAFGEPAPGLPPATLFETLEAPGVTNPAQIFKFGRYTHAVRKLRPETFILSTDIEHIASHRGDLVFVTHDVPLIGSSSGRIRRVVRDSNQDVTHLELDEPAPMVTGKEYGIRVRLQDGSSLFMHVITDDTLPTIVELETPLSGQVPGQPKGGDLFQFGERGIETRQMLIQAMEMDRDLGAQVSLLDYAPGVFTADTEPIPDWDPGITEPPDYANQPEDPIIESIRSDDYVMVRSADGSLQERILVRTRKVTSNRRPRPTHLQARWRKRPTDGTQPAAYSIGAAEPVELSEVSILPVQEGVAYDLSVRHIDRIGRASGWVNAVHTVIGKTLPPPDLEAFNVQRLADGTRRYTWVLGDVPPDVIGVRVRYGPQGVDSWESMVPLQDDDGDTFLQGSPTDLNRPDAGAYTFAAKAVDTSGNESANAIFVDVTLGPPRQEGVAFSEEANSLGWPGTKLDCFVEPDTGHLRASDSTTWDDLTTWDAFTSWSLNPAGFMQYTHTPIDVGAVIDAQLSYAIDGIGSIMVEARVSEDGVAYGDWFVVDNTDETSRTFRAVQFRASVTAQFTGQDLLLREFLMEVRAFVRDVTLPNLNTATLPQYRRIAAGDVRLPVGSTVFRAITSVSLAFTDPNSAGWTWRVVDKLVTGPRVQIFNADGELADAIVDVVIRGL